MSGAVGVVEAPGGESWVNPAPHASAAQGALLHHELSQALSKRRVQKCISRARKAVIGPLADDTEQVNFTRLALLVEKAVAPPEEVLDTPSNIVMP